MSYPNLILEKFAENYSLNNNIFRLNLDCQIFVDSRDIFEMIMGALSYKKGRKKISYNDLPDKKLLIHAHIYNNNLEKCFLLTPHQQELLYNLQKWLKPESDFEQEFQNIQSLVVNNGIKLLKKKSNIQNYVDDIDKYRKEIEKIIVDVYKINYLAEGDRWQARLVQLKSEKILALDKTENIFELLKTPLFKSLKQGFAEIRGNRDNMNTADALVLCILAKKLEDVNKGTLNATLPLFFDASGIFSKVISLKKEGKKFLFKIKNGTEKYSIIRDVDYFNIHALQLDTLEEKDGLGKLLFDVKNSLNNNNQQKITLKKKIEKINTTIQKLLSSQLMKTFYDGKINTSIEDLISATKAKSNLVKDKIDSELNDLVTKLKRDLKSYIIESGTYNSIEAAFWDLSNEAGLLKNIEIFRRKNTDDFYPLQVFSLVKFSINSHIQEGTENLLKDIFLNIHIEHNADGTIKHIEIDKNNANVYPTILSNLKEGLLNDNARKRMYLAIGISILWVLGKYNVVCRILDQINGEYHYYSTAFLHAASIAKQIKTVEDLEKKKLRIREILNYVDNYRDHKYKFTENYRTALGAAHIYFQLWDKSNANEIKFSIGNPEPRPEKSKSNSREYLDKAIFLLENALKWLRDDERYIENNHRKQCYYTILNNYIFYITKGCKNDKFDEINLIDGDIGKLSRESNDQKLWQPIFDDTLALVNLRKALLLRKQNENFEKPIREAKRRINKALNSTLRIDDYNNFIETRNNINELINELNRKKRSKGN